MWFNSFSIGNNNKLVLLFIIKHYRRLAMQFFKNLTAMIDVGFCLASKFSVTSTIFLLNKNIVTGIQTNQNTPTNNCWTPIRHLNRYHRVIYVHWWIIRYQFKNNQLITAIEKFKDHYDSTRLTIGVICSIEIDQ